MSHSPHLRRIDVVLGDRSYTVSIGPGQLDDTD